MFIKWVTDQGENHVHLALQTANKYKISEGTMTFQFGSFEKKIDVQIVSDFPEDSIGLPQHWTNHQTIPDTLPYELKKVNNTLKLGPVIALIVFSKLNEMTPSKLNGYKGYFYEYAKINGLIYLCAWNTIDTKRKQIKGYYYDRYENNESKRWKFGTFPYPNSAYNRTAMPRAVFYDLVGTIGDRVFNSYSNGSFNKWELWKRLSPVGELYRHLPATEQLTDLPSLDNMLKSHQSIYLKPSGGTLSQGIMKVGKSPTGYLVTYPERKKGEGPVQKHLDRKESIDQWFNKLKRKKYLAQQAITMNRYKNKPIDFRVIMQKNGVGQWECSGIFGKFGKSGNIITNFTQNGFIRSGIDTFKIAFNMNDEKALMKIEELKKIALRICQVFDEYGNYGDLGMDLMVDQEESIWILEVNTLDTYHRFPLHMDDRALYKKVVTSPFRYAKYLAGFDYEEN